VSRTVRCVLAFALMLLVVDSVNAKGRTVRMTIAGQHLGEPLEVTNPKALINIWTGTRAPESWFDFPRPFFGGLTEEPAVALPRYTVSFYVDAFTEQPRVRKLYAVRYVPDPLTGAGFVYLPASSDVDMLPLFLPITRPGKDGRWLRASSEWSGAINAHLAAVSGLR
jgi:hypothetical protein